MEDLGGIAGIISFINSAYYYAETVAKTTINIMLVLEVCLLGYMIAINKISNLTETIWKFFQMGVCVWVAVNLRKLSLTVLYGFLKIANGMFNNSAVRISLTNPTKILKEIIGNNFKTMWIYASEMQAEAKVIDVGAQATAIIFYCVAIFMLLVILVSIANFYLAYLDYLFTILWGTLLYPATLYKPLAFIGQNVIRGIFSSLLKMGIIYFILLLGTGLLKKGMDMGNIPEENVIMFLIEKVVVCALVCYLTFQANHITSAIVTGNPSTSGLGLRSMAAAAGTALVGGMMAKGAAATLGKGALQGVGAGVSAYGTAGGGMEGLKHGLAVGGSVAGRAAGREAMSKLGDMRSTADNMVRRRLGIAGKAHESQTEGTTLKDIAKGAATYRTNSDLTDGGTERYRTSEILARTSQKKGEELKNALVDKEEGSEA